MKYLSVCLPCIVRHCARCCEPDASRCALQAPLAGEIIAYLAEEGDPVEYRQELVEIAPYFGALAFALSLVPLARQNRKMRHFFHSSAVGALMVCSFGVTGKPWILFGKA